jgi:hypothetical protein
MASGITRRDGTGKSIDNTNPMLTKYEQWNIRYEASDTPLLG